MPKSEEAKAIETLTKAVEALDKSVKDILAEMRAARRAAQRPGG